MTKQEFINFSKSKKIYDEDEAIKLFYDNKYKLFCDSVKSIYAEMTAYHDIIYYYDSEKGIIIEHSYYIGD